MKFIIELEADETIDQKKLEKYLYGDSHTYRSHLKFRCMYEKPDLPLAIEKLQKKAEQA